MSHVRGDFDFHKWKKGFYKIPSFSTTNQIPIFPNSLIFLVLVSEISVSISKYNQKYLHEQIPLVSSKK